MERQQKLDLFAVEEMTLSESKLDLASSILKNLPFPSLYYSKKCSEKGKSLTKPLILKILLNSLRQNCLLHKRG